MVHLSLLTFSTRVPILFSITLSDQTPQYWWPQFFFLLGNSFIDYSTSQYSPNHDKKCLHILIVSLYSISSWHTLCVKLLFFSLRKAVTKMGTLFLLKQHPPIFSNQIYPITVSLMLDAWSIYGQINLYTSKFPILGSFIPLQFYRTQLTWLNPYKIYEHSSTTAE